MNARELKVAAAVIGRRLVSKQAPGAVPTQPVAPEGAGQLSVGQANVPVMTDEQKKLMLAVLVTRVDGAKKNADHVLGRLAAGEADFPQAFTVVSEYRSAIELLMTQGKKLKPDAPWAPVDQAFAQADAMLRRAADDWNFRPDVGSVTPTLVEAKGLYDKADQAVRGALKAAGLA